VNVRAENAKLAEARDQVFGKRSGTVVLDDARHDFGVDKRSNGVTDHAFFRGKEFFDGKQIKHGVTKPRVPRFRNSRSTRNA
jgi:hypothetical protein